MRENLKNVFFAEALCEIFYKTDISKRFTVDSTPLKGSTLTRSQLKRYFLHGRPLKMSYVGTRHLNVFMYCEKILFPRLSVWSGKGLLQKKIFKSFLQRQFI